MPRDELNQEIRFSERDDDADDVGYTGGGGGGGAGGGGGGGGGSAGMSRRLSGRTLTAASRTIRWCGAGAW